MTENNLGRVDQYSASKLAILADLDTGRMSPADPQLKTWRFDQVGRHSELEVADAGLDLQSYAVTEKINREWSKMSDLAGVDKDQVAEILEDKDYDYFGVIGTLVFPENKVRADILASKMRQNGSQAILAEDGELQQDPQREVSDDEIITRVPVLTRLGSKTNLLEVSLGSMITDKVISAERLEDVRSQPVEETQETQETQLSKALEKRVDGLIKALTEKGLDPTEVVTRRQAQFSASQPLAVEPAAEPIVEPEPELVPEPEPELKQEPEPKKPAREKKPKKAKQKAKAGGKKEFDWQAELKLGIDAETTEPEPAPESEDLNPEGLKPTGRIGLLPIKKLPDSAKPIEESALPGWLRTSKAGTKPDTAEVQNEEKPQVPKQTQEPELLDLGSEAAMAEKPKVQEFPIEESDDPLDKMARILRDYDKASFIVKKKSFSRILSRLIRQTVELEHGVDMSEPDFSGGEIFPEGVPMAVKFRINWRNFGVVRQEADIEMNLPMEFNKQSGLLEMGDGFQVTSEKTETRGNIVKLNLKESLQPIQYSLLTFMKKGLEEQDLSVSLANSSIDYAGGNIRITLEKQTPVDQTIIKDDEPNEVVTSEQEPTSFKVQEATVKYSPEKGQILSQVRSALEGGKKFEGSVNGADFVQIVEPLINQFARDVKVSNIKVLGLGDGQMKVSSVVSAGDRETTITLDFVSQNGSLSLTNVSGIGFLAKQYLLRVKKVNIDEEIAKFTNRPLNDLILDGINAGMGEQEGWADSIALNFKNGAIEIAVEPEE